MVEDTVTVTDTVTVKDTDTVSGLVSSGVSLTSWGEGASLFSLGWPPL